MSGYIGNIPVPQATQTRDVFTATGGQTSFATSGYTPGYVDVWLNGVKLVNGTDFTATNGSDVVLASGAATSDIVEVLSYSTYEVNAQTYTGGLTAKNDGAAAITADRLTSDGAVIDVQKNGYTVGSIFNNGVNLGIGAGDAALLFAQNVDAILPYNASTNAERDNAINLGRPQGRFKDLYLSGGVYLGGTGGENLLDDYEEGTWTPTNGGSTTYIERSGQYTKVGNMVFIRGLIDISSLGTGSSQVISGLPFASTQEYTIPLSKLQNSSLNFYSAQLRTFGSSLYISAQDGLDGSITVNQNFMQGSTLAQFSGVYLTS